jgi:hypothetical protein
VSVVDDEVLDDGVLDGAEASVIPEESDAAAKLAKLEAITREAAAARIAAGAMESLGIRITPQKLK